MPIRLEADHTHRRLTAQAVGVLTRDDVLQFLRTARSGVERQNWPLLFDATGATATLEPADVESAVAVVRAAVLRDGMRAHVALVAGDDALYRWLIDYETRCAEMGVRVIRTFRRRDDAERWLEIVSAARRFI